MYFPLLSEDIWGVITKFGVSQNLEFLLIGSSEKTSKIAPEISFFLIFFLNVHNPLQMHVQC